MSQGNDDDEDEDSDGDGNDGDGNDDGHGDGVVAFETCVYRNMCTSRVAAAACCSVKNGENEFVRDTQTT